MATLTENAVRITSAASDIKSAIIAKGQTPTGGMDTYADAISAISGGGGTDVSDTTATAGDVLAGDIFHVADGTKTTGTMTNNGAFTGTISTKDGTVTIPAGYHNGSGSVGISSAEQEKIVAENIVSGVSILGVDGTASSGVQPCTSSTMLANEWVTCAKGTSKTVTVSWTGKAQTIAYRYTRTSSEDASYMALVVINVNDDGTYNMLVQRGTTSGEGETDTLVSVSQTSITLTGNSSSYTYGFGVMAFGTGTASSVSVTEG